MPHKVFAAGKAGQYGALRFKIVKVFIHRRRNVSYHSGKGVPANIEYRLNVGAVHYFPGFLIQFQPHTEVREHIYHLGYVFIVILKYSGLVFLVVLVLSVSFKKSDAVSKPAFIIKIPCPVNLSALFNPSQGKVKLKYSTQTA